MAVTKTRRVIHKASLSVFPTVGKVGIIYIAEDTDTTYLWDETTSSYVAENASIDARVTNLENKYESKELFEDISGTTTGTVTTYTNISILQDAWAGENNAIAVEVSAGRPTQDFLYTAAGVLVEAIVTDTALSVLNVTRSSNIVTVETSGIHGLNIGDKFSLSGADQTGYNGSFTVDTIINTTEFTYLISETPVTPATGIISINIGNYTLSGTPTATDYAICWITTGKAVDYGIANIPESKIINEFDLETPYVRNSVTGAIQAINPTDYLGMQNQAIVDVGHIDFYLTVATAMQEGRLQWDETASTLVLGMPGGEVMLQIGQELYLPRKLKNTSGVDIKNGDAIYVNGGSGVNSFVALADATDIDKADKTLAIATEDIPATGDNPFGYCTKFGLVKGTPTQPINTSIGVAGDILYLDPLNPGKFTVTKPEAPNRVVRLGNIFTAHATEGIIVATIDIDRAQMIIDVTKEPTGFSNNTNIVVTGDSSTRTVTLSGTGWDTYYRGDPYYTITNGWTSAAHDNVTTKQYFLNYDGSSIQWTDASTIDIDTFYTYVQIAFAFYVTDPLTPANSKWVYLRETHGIMTHDSHREWHETYGTYKISGGTFDPASYVVDSTTAADRRPLIVETKIKDEDNISTLPALSSEIYTRYYLSGADATPNFEIDVTDMLKLSGSQPYFNEFTGGVWTNTLVPNNHYFATFTIALPMSADSGSQAIRYIHLQPQETSLVLANIRAISFADLNLGGLTDLSPEYVAIIKTIYRYTGGDWKIVEVENLDKSRVDSTSTPAGNYLSVVTSNDSLSGSGTVGDPLGINLGNTNIWTIIQSFLSGIGIGTKTTITEDGSENLVTANTSTTGGFIHKLGDILGVCKHYWQNSSGTEVANIDSEGNAELNKDQNSVHDISDYLDQVWCRFNSNGGYSFIKGLFGLGGVIAPQAAMHNGGGYIDKVTIVSAATYTVLIDDFDIDIQYTTTGVVTITIPAALDYTGRTFVFTDTDGNAGTNNISVYDDAGTPNLLFTMSTNSETQVRRYNGTSWALR